MRQCRLVSRLGLAAAILLNVFLLQFPALAEHGRIEEIKVHSKALEGNLLGDSAERNVTVYLPPEYDETPEKRFPVVYLLHGYTGNDKLWTGGGYVKGLNIASIADDLITNNRIKAMLLVAPDCHNAYGGSWYTNSPVTGNWEDFVAKELIRDIVTKFRTIADRTSRGIAGHSMGGHGAIKLAMKHPELYCALYAMSPAWNVFTEALRPPFAKHFSAAVAAKQRDAFPGLHWRSRGSIALAAAVAPNPQSQPFFGELPVDANGNRIQRVWQRWLKHDLFTMIGTHRESLLKYKAISIDCGSEEDLLPMNKIFSKALADARVEHTFEQFEGTHTNRVARQMRDKVLPLFSRTLQFDAGAKVKNANAKASLSPEL
jgi:S-formylglutathione hydrolase